MKKALGAKAVAVPSPVWVVGTYDESDVPNLMTVAWGGICCSKPASLCIALREATYSYRNVVARNAFTINIPPQERAREADLMGILSGRDGNKFDAAGLTAVRCSAVDAPYVEEFPIAIACTVTHTVPIGLHTLFVGRIHDVMAEASVLNEKGLPRMAAVRPFVFSAAEQRYYEIGADLGPAFTIGRDLQSSS